MELTLGIDFGTSYFKLGLFDRSGELRGLGRVAVESETDGARCELRVGRYWAALREGLSKALEAAAAQPSDIKGLGYSSQANTFLCLDADDQPLTPLIMWTDVRSEPVEPAIADLWGRDDFLQTTAVGVGGGFFCLAKLAWIQKHHPEVWKKTRRVQTICDYFVYSLTGEAVGDEGTTSLMGHWNLPGHEFWEPALQGAKVTADMLSHPKLPGTVGGVVTEEGGARIGLPGGIPLAVGSLDHQIAAIGAGIGKSVDFSESTGTVLAVMHYGDEYTPKPNCIMGPGSHGSTYYQLAWSDNGASHLEWYQKNHAADLSIAELVELAAQVPIGSDGLIALPCASQYDDLDGFVNKQDKHERGHYARAILESTAGTLVQLVKDLSPSKPARRIVATGGGAKSALWRQIKADLLATEFVTTNCEEPACKGAAMLSACAAGWFDTLQDATDAWVWIVHVSKPDRANHDLYAQWYESYAEAVSGS